MTPPQTLGWIGSRRLLRQLRDLMKGGGSVQDRLNRTVALIADDMVAEVCSFYLLRAGEVLELFATKGLSPEAVHRTRLRLGEGIVGDIAAHARPLSLPDAQDHPNFAYRPETGEEIYHSMLGVPVLRDGRVLGVLAVQNRASRHYGEEEIETLETVAMVLAELLSSGDLAVTMGSGSLNTSEALPARFGGVVLNEGLAIGRVVLHDRGIVIRQVVAEDPAVELKRLDAALKAMYGQLDDLLARDELADGGEHQEVLETYRMFAEDRGWVERIREQVQGGLSAAAAVQRVQNDLRTRMNRVKDPYLRERYADFEDLGNRLLHHLLGSAGSAEDRGLPDDTVLLARSLGPADLLDYDAAKLKAVVLEEGSPTAHVAIVARALGIPMVGRCRDVLTRARQDDVVVVDGVSGQVLLRPRSGIRDSFVEAIRVGEERRQLFAATRDLPAVTRDGVAVSLQVNAGLLVDLPQLHASGADGVGLYRTEVPFMVRDSFPDVAAQVELYARVLDQAEGKPVTFRTLDVGGDKVLPYWGGTEDDNPSMGWRAIRIGLDRPAMLRQQLRALVCAAAGRDLRVMFPMIAEVSEFVRAKHLLEREVQRQSAKGGEVPDRVETGVMLEVPALAWQLPTLFDLVDFVSVGSNDLLQFLFASDRGNPRLARRYDILSPPALSFLLSLTRQADDAGVRLSLCGEAAGHPLEAMALIGAGFRILSMPPPGIGPVKLMLRSLELGPLQAYLHHLAGLPHASVRGLLRAYARDRGVSI